MGKKLQLPDNNNLKLSNLCGPFDENLKQISNGLEIKINRKGSRFIINGSTINSELGCKLIEEFYNRSTKPITPEDIQLSLVQISKINPSNEKKSPQLLTLKNELQGRTPRQIEYLQNIQLYLAPKGSHFERYIFHQDPLFREVKPPN